MTHVGIDLSSFRLDYAWLDDRTHPVTMTQKLGTPRQPITERIRNMDFLDATREIWSTKRWVSSVIIEKPYGRLNIVSPLMAVVGAITAGIPKDIPVHWVGVSQLRSAIGAKNSKEDAWRMLTELTSLTFDGWDEHMKDALVVCVGGALMIEQGMIVSKLTPKRKRA